MVETLLAPYKDHAFALVAAASFVCVVASWLFFALMDRARGAAGRLRGRWLGGAALVAGIGIWATHFLATLAYRPDFAFLYDPGLTAASAAIGVFAVGVPAALTALTDRAAPKLLGGALAGVGLAGLHLAGTAALVNCTAPQPGAPAGLAALAGAALVALALVLPAGRLGGPRVALLALAVALVHSSFETCTGLVPVASGARELDQGFVGLLVGLVTLGLLVGVGALTASAAKLAERRRQTALFSVAFNNMSNGLLLIGARGRIELFNQRLIDLFDIEPGAVAIGMEWQRFLANLAVRLGWSEARLARVIHNHIRWFGAGRTTYLEHGLDDGRTISVACRPIEGGGAVLTYDDVTAERQAQREVERLAFQDPLTGLPNLRRFRQELEAAAAGPGGATLLLVDLDRFKIVNDTLGHAAGDRLLIECGERMAAVCDAGEFLARLAGDEFAVLSPSGEEDRAALLSERIVAALAEPFLIQGRRTSVGCSIGVASTRDAPGAEMMVQYADLALYKAKTLGRGRSQRYEAGMQEAAVRRSLLEADLRPALERGEFALHYQPLYRIEDRALIGFEALIRWHHPQRGPVSPAEFIPVAEETGAIVEIGLWIAAQACRAVRQWPDGIFVAVNVSPVQLRCEDFAERMMQIVREAGIDPRRFEIELTETALAEDGEPIAASLRTLRASGIRVAMDDFGTGYSSLAHLRKFDLDGIKIDLSFVQTAPFDPAAAAVLRAVVQLADGLGVGTVGEGVETEEQLAMLRRVGCQVAQGYLLGRPMAEAQALALCRAEAHPVARRRTASEGALA